MPLQAERLLRVLGEHEVEFVIIGGFALSAHGVIRGTKDIDIVPDPGAGNLARLAEALRVLDAEVMLADDFDSSELGLAPDEDGLSMGGNWVLRTSLGRLDVMQDVAGLAGSWTSRTYNASALWETRDGSPRRAIAATKASWSAASTR